MIDLDCEREFSRDEHVQPGDLVSDSKDYQCEACAEETLKEVADHVIGR